MNKNKLKRLSGEAGRGFLLLIILLLIFGCGKKGDPLPPLAPEVPAAQGLEASMNQETVALSWQVGSKDPSALAGFTVYRAQIDPKVDDCPGCPLIFKRIAELPASEIRWQENRSVYVDRPEGGVSLRL